jgi:hypothetical protein
MDDYIEKCLSIEKAFTEHSSEELYGQYKNILENFYILAKKYRVSKNPKILEKLKDIGLELQKMQKLIKKDKSNIYVFADLSKLLINGANPKSTMIWLPPKEFLRLAGSVGSIQRKLKDNNERSAKTIDKYYFDILNKEILPLELELSPNNRFVVRHDGRHRAYAAAMIPKDIKMPVELFWKVDPSNIDLSTVRRQDDPYNQKTKVRLPERKKEDLVDDNIKTLKIVLDKAMDDMSDKHAWKLYDEYVKKLEEFFKIAESYGRTRSRIGFKELPVTKEELQRFQTELRNRGKELGHLQKQIRTLAPERKFPFMDIGPYIKEGVSPNAKVVWITPEKFLHLASDMGLMYEGTDPKHGPDKDLISVGHQIHRQTKGRIRVPDLVVDLNYGKVRRHEGRHRAYALSAAGWGDKKIPVVVYNAEQNVGDDYRSEPIPYDKEIDPEKFKTQEYDLSDTFDPDFENKLNEVDENIEENIKLSGKPAEQAYQEYRQQMKFEDQKKKATQRALERGYRNVQQNAVRGFKPEPIRRKKQPYVPPVVETNAPPEDVSEHFKRLEEATKSLRKALLALAFS